MTSTGKPPVSPTSAPARILARRVLYHGFGIYEELEVEQERAGGGSLRLSREVQRRSDVVAVLPYDAERRVARVARQLRVPLLARGDGDAFLIEAPAGHIDEGESAEEAARREALEEVGVSLPVLEPVASVFASPGAITERLSLFLAPYGAGDVSDLHGGGLDEEGEEIEILELPLATLEETLCNGLGIDAKTLLLVQALRLKRPDLFG